MSELGFYFLAAASIASASGVVLLRNPVHSALALVAALMLVAVAYAALGAHLVAALQIIIYTGAVMILFLFVIMLLNLQADPREAPRPLAGVVGIGSALAVAGAIGSVLWRWASSSAPGLVLGAEFGTTRGLARVLFTDHVVAFELTSVLLLVAVVGAVVLARREHDQGCEQRATRERSV